MEAKRLTINHPDRVLTREEEIILYEILCDEVAWLRSTLSLNMDELDEKDPEKLIIQAEIDKINNDLRYNLKNVDEEKALSRYVVKRLRELGKITHAE